LSLERKAAWLQQRSATKKRTRYRARHSKGKTTKTSANDYKPGPVGGVVPPGFEPGFAEPGFEVPGFEPGLEVPGFEPGFVAPGLVDPPFGVVPGFDGVEGMVPPFGLSFGIVPVLGLLGLGVEGAVVLPFGLVGFDPG
jgi:hypothetical protein